MTNRAPDDALVSVVIPVYDGEAFVARAIGSVLSQTHTEVEAVVVNDGSRDGTADVIEALAEGDERVRVVHKQNGGLAAARNTGIEHARGEYVNFLDADDWLLDHKLRLQLGALAGAPDRDLVYSDYVKVDEADCREYEVPRGVPPVPFERLYVYRNWFAPMVPLLRRALVDRVGPFDPGFRAAEDWDYWLRCARLTDFVYAPGVVAKYRLHGGQMHRDHDRMNEAHRRLASKHFGDDGPRYRSSMAYYHLDNARFRKGRGEYGRCARHLASYLASVRSLAEARLVWRLP